MGWQRWAAAAGAGVFAARMYRRRKAWAGAPRISRLELTQGAGTAETDEGSVQFIGTATTLIRFGGFTILTDPNFLHRGEQVHLGYGLRSTRLTEPALSMEELPPVDFVVLSHLHEDHFDRRVARALPKDTPILTTPEAAASLRRKGFWRAAAVDTWRPVEVRKGNASMRLTAMPGTHGPMLVSAFLPEVMGSMLDFRDRAGGNSLRLYITGDTLVFEDLEDIPRRYPGIDVALLHLGGTRVLGVLVTMDAIEGVRALEIVAPKLAIPIHYNDYTVFRSPLADFQREAIRAGWEDRVRYLRHGETFALRPAEIRGLEMEKARG
jgi:L-ascorbate metabolism protein UlaG (beta-lactamase superfamily)